MSQLQQPQQPQKQQTQRRYNNSQRQPKLHNKTALTLTIKEQTNIENIIAKKQNNAHTLHSNELHEKHITQVNILSHRNLKQEARDIVELFF